MDSTVETNGPELSENDELDKEHESTIHDSFSVKLSIYTARNPTKCLLGSIIIVSILSVIAFTLGGFTIAVDNDGWRSRGTLIAEREIQSYVFHLVKNSLFQDEDGTAWDQVENNVVSDDDDDNERGNTNTPPPPPEDECIPSKLYTTMLAKDNLFAVYKVQNSKSILDPEVIFEICEAETKTHEALMEYDACAKCEQNVIEDEEKTSSCLPPFSMVWILRLTYGKLDSSCSELKEFYTKDIQEEFTDSLVQCTQDIIASYDSSTQTYETSPQCPIGFQVNLVDTEFGIDGNKILTYSSSYFFTYTLRSRKVFNLRKKYGMTDDKIVSIAYDTLQEDHNGLYTNKALLADMILALGSIIITNVAVATHTKSLWLTFIGNLQVILSVPLAYFVYYFIVGLEFFPFLNFMGLFVASAIGADDIFVAVDKWKNARLKDVTVPTEVIAAIALPSAASAMLLTTSTTAVAFFATTICPVAPILCFAVFCGLLIVFNYILNILFIFPALCLYDIWLQKPSHTSNCCLNFDCCGQSIFERRATDGNGEEKQASFIHRILNALYRIIHQFRYILLVACLVALGVCIYVALTIKLPDSADVRLLPESSSYEKHFKWKQELLSFPFFYSSGGSGGTIFWGIHPDDTGNQNNPKSLSTLSLDTTFDLSSTEAQTYMLHFCDNLYESGIASPYSNTYECPMNEFDTWLRNQTTSTEQDDFYISSCNNATSLPMEEDYFDSCMIAWSKSTTNQNVLAKQSKIAIIRATVQHAVKWDAPFREMDKFWKEYEDYMKKERDIAPAGVNNMFQASGAFWWYDTNISMLQTAIGAALIAISFAAVIVFFSTLSFLLSLFAAICITYVLAATTASLVGLGWDLGFLESICFAILVGISCDFVIHFGHAYNHFKGDVSRHERTKYAVIHMGGSIAAAAFTTIAAATIMLFCQVVFFTKFALILLMTVLHAAMGSFIVYLVLTDCFGPSNPTKFVDSLFSRCSMRSKGPDMERKGDE